MLHLRREGHAVAQDQARSLLAAEGWRTIRLGPPTTKAQPGTASIQYLLRKNGRDAIRGGVVRNITYIRVGGGFFYCQP